MQNNFFLYFNIHQQLNYCNVLITILIFLKSLCFKILVLNNLCTDKMRSCDMREHSDWLRVILGYKSVQIFHSAMIFA